MKLLTRAQALGKKITLISTAFILAVSTLTAVVPFVLSEKASAVGGVVEIHNAAELRTAIENQADGQNWKIYAGSYAVTPTDAITAGNQTGWHFPITADNLTINGVGNPTIYGNGYAPNGNWATQDFVAIFGDNVTLNGLTLMPKVEANKTIEVMGDNSTIKNVTIKPNTLSTPTDPWGGSIYYNDDSAGDTTPQTVQTLSNVTIRNGGVSVHSASATINVTDVDLIYQTDIDWINEYRFYLPYASTILNGAPTYTYNVSNALNNINGALAAIGGASTAVSAENETIKLFSDLYASHQITINKPNVTIDAKRPMPGDVYYTIFGNFDTQVLQNGKRDGSNNSVLSVQANGVRINQLNIDGRNHELHGINTYNAQDLQLWRVAVKNNGFSGLNVNRSWVQGVDLTTEHNGWHGVDVDNPNAFFQSAGINHHNETLTHADSGKTRPVPALYIDDTQVGTVNDTNGQYVSVNNYWKSGDRAYFLKSDVQAAQNLNIKYQYDSAPLADGATVNVTSKAGNNNLVLTFDALTSPAAVDHYITTETRPDGTSENVWNGSRNTWIAAGKNAVGVNDSQAEFGYHGNGQYTYTVTVYYKNGTSATSDAISLWFDNQSPVTAFTEAPADNSFVKGDFTVKAEASDSSQLKNVIFDVRDPSAAPGTNAWRAGCVAGTMNIAYSADNKSATLDCTINTSGLAEGHQYIVRVHAGDYAGYGSASTNSTRTFTVDRHDPTLSAGLSFNTVVETGSTPELTVNAADTLSGVDYVQYRIQNADGSSIPGYGWVTVANGSVTNLSEIDGLTDGSYRVNTRAFDTAGNKKNTLINFEVNRAISSTVNVSSLSTVTPVISGTITHDADGSPAANKNVLVKVDGAQYPTTTNANGFWSIDATVAAGEHEVIVGLANASVTASPLATKSFTTVLQDQSGDATGDGTGTGTGAGTGDGQGDNLALPDAANRGAAGIQGASDDATDDTTGTPSVEGASTVKNLAEAVNNTDGKAFGLAWYWWLLILAGIVTFLWWIIAAVRNRQNADA